MVPTTLFKSVRSSSHEQSVPTTDKPVNNTVQAGQLNHVQAGQLKFKPVNSQKQAVHFYVCIRKPCIAICNRFTKAYSTA